jgi:hypothetical protein
MSKFYLVLITAVMDNLIKIMELKSLLDLEYLYRKLFLNDVTNSCLIIQNYNSSLVSATCRIDTSISRWNLITTIRFHFSFEFKSKHKFSLPIKQFVSI